MTIGHFQQMRVREDEREWDTAKKRGVVGVSDGGWGGGEGVELVEVGGSVSEKWDRREMHVTADKEEKEEDITSFFMKIITLFDCLYIQNSLTDFYFFWLKLLVAMPPFRIHYVRLKIFYIFYIFCTPKKWILMTRNKRLYVFYFFF